MGKVISFKDFELNKAIKMLADDYFDFIGFVYSLELYDSDRYKHTKIINIKYLEGYDKEVLAGECQAYYTMHAKYPKSYPLDRNWSIEFLPHFQNPKKIAKLSHKEKVETIKKEKYELLKQIYCKKDFYLTMEEMNKGTYSTHSEIKNWWITHYAEIEFLKQMKYELNLI